MNNVLNQSEFQNEFQHEVIRLLKEILKSNNNEMYVSEGSQLLDSEQVRVYLKISNTTLIKIENNGEIMPKKVGREKRYLMSDILNYINQQ